MHICGHYDDVIMTMLASQITSLMVVYSIVYSGINQRKHQSSASLAFVREIHRGPVNFPHKWPVTRKMFPFDDVIMTRERWVKGGVMLAYFQSWGLITDCMNWLYIRHKGLLKLGRIWWCLTICYQTRLPCSFSGVPCYFFIWLDETLISHHKNSVVCSGSQWVYIILNLSYLIL